MLFSWHCAKVNVFAYREMQEMETRRSLNVAFVAFCLMIHSSISHLISQFINFKGFSYEQVQWSCDEKVLIFHKEQENRFMWCCSHLVFILKCRYAGEQRNPISPNTLPSKMQRHLPASACLLRDLRCLFLYTFIIKLFFLTDNGL